MAKTEIIVKVEELVESAMKGNDASHDAAHSFRVRDLALSLVREEGLSTSSHSILIVELAALLHDIALFGNSTHIGSERLIRIYGEKFFKGLNELGLFCCS